MTKKVKGGEVFAIPLFMPKDDWKLRLKLDKDVTGKAFVFGRVIEDNGGSGILVEIFNKVGHRSTRLEEIIRADRLFEPIHIFWVGITKKRWRLHGVTEPYDKFKDSNYSNIKMVFGSDDNIRLRDFATKTETKISREEAKNYEFSMTWFPIDLEQRIITELK